MPARKWWCFRTFILCLCIQLVLLIVCTWEHPEHTNRAKRSEDTDGKLNKLKPEVKSEDTGGKQNISKPEVNEETKKRCPANACPRSCNITVNDVPHKPNISSYESLSSSWEASETFLDGLAQRRKNVKEVCHKYSLDQPSPSNKVNAWEFMINSEYNLVWCNVFKAASTTWMYVFNRLAGYDDQTLRSRLDMSPVMRARRCYKRPSEQELLSVMQSKPEFTSFMVTRHPLERLVSYYRNKYIDDIPDKYIRAECSTIKRMYKLKKPRRHFVDPGLNPKTGCGHMLPNFVQFIAHVIQRVKRNHKDLNMHWVPMYKFCSACLVDFKIFAKVDTMDDDGEYILQSAAINNIIKLNKLNPGKLGETKSLAEAYLCQLPQQMMDQLVQVYQYDLELFQYDVKKYISCTRNQ